MENSSPFVVRKNREESLVLDLQDSISSIQLSREDVAEFLKNELFYLSTTYPRVFRSNVLKNDDLVINVGGSKEKNISLTLSMQELYEIKLRIKIGDNSKIYFLEERENNLPGYHLTTNGRDDFELRDTVINSDFKYTLINLLTTKTKEWSTDNTDKNNA